MAQVETVRGPIPVEELGTTLMHEHVFMVNPELLDNHGDFWDEEVRVADAIERLGELRARGVDTIVDPTVIGLGRHLPRIQRVNAEVDINIVAATGLYAFHDLPQFLHYRGPGTPLGGPEPMTEMFVRDIRVGIADTGVKAAFLKCVVDEYLTPQVERVARAVAAASVETGAPITVHTNAEARSGTAALTWFAEEGVDLTRVVVGHAGDSNDLDYLRSLADQGAVLGCDRFGVDTINPTERRVATIAALAEQGYADRIVLSHDAWCYADLFAGEETMALVRQVLPNWNYLHISDDVLPALRAAGVTDAQIDMMLTGTPRRYFSGADAPEAASG
ncbi:phosphotriesterase-related protein [Spinactinospora alkalitolerans]|uniref:Phosphotriesterase-related protein n=1 Tax=Spinactinospora alkalitolerans TaxID=687207 RepID=A0A852U1S4_9ACTN|nr:phosphotriesterase [Spinactinospora alkalitolerans]NYE49537.1 phosphotriesterase-related protein [Spinactinospora alkalitolerans]